MSDLEKIVRGYKNDLEKLETYEDVERFLDYALDIEILVDLETKTVNGFDICVCCGGPNVYIIYSRGYARVEGYWLPEKTEISFDKEKAELICDYLQDIWEGIIWS